MNQARRFAPLETWYRGVQYRSRTEARWAVFFHTAGVVARYEPEGYRLDDGTCYLPDFCVGPGSGGEATDEWRQCDAWIEIKGREPTDAEVLKALRLARLTAMPVYIFWGDVAAPSVDTESAFAAAPDGTVEAYYRWTECPVCARVDVAYDGRVDAMPCRCPSGSGGRLAPPERGDATPRLLAAYRAAKGERFDGYKRR